jgi:ketosteroid isomerase-like protein
LGAFLFGSGIGHIAGYYFARGLFVKKIIELLCMIALSSVFAGMSMAQDSADNEAGVAAVLDSLHDAASKADYDRYFGLYSKDAIFLGTDATERWDLAQFKAYTGPIFAKGRGWTYAATRRWIYVSDDGNTAWFDETLENANLGDCRGSGVLVKQNGQWLIAQYNLTIPVPNDLADEFVKRIREQ